MELSSPTSERLDHFRSDAKETLVGLYQRFRFGCSETTETFSDVICDVLQEIDATRHCQSFGAFVHLDDGPEDASSTPLTGQLHASSSVGFAPQVIWSHVERDTLFPALFNDDSLSSLSPLSPSQSEHVTNYSGIRSWSCSPPLYQANAGFQLPERPEPHCYPEVDFPVDTSYTVPCPFEASSDLSEDLYNLLQNDWQGGCLSGFSILRCSADVQSRYSLRPSKKVFYAAYEFPGQVTEQGCVSFKYHLEQHSRNGQNKADTDARTNQAVVKQFEAMITGSQAEKTDSQGSVLYASSIPAHSVLERELAGVPCRSPIFPLRGNALVKTRDSIPGIHTPYAYRALSPYAPFALHREDCDLFSLNYLYAGEKIWIIIEPNSLTTLERHLRPPKYNCAQFLRHSSSWVLTSTLDAWQVRYKVVRQHAGEIVLIHPGAYHQGFSVGITVAEAVNYATSLDIQNYEFCHRSKCPPGPIIRSSDMILRGHDEDDLVLEISNENVFTEIGRDVPTRKITKSKLSQKSDQRTVKQSYPEQFASSDKKKKTSESLASPRNPLSEADVRDDDQISIGHVDDDELDHDLLNDAHEDWHLSYCANPTFKAVYAHIASISPMKNSDLFQRLFYAIGSRTAISQLKDACAAQARLPPQVIQSDPDSLIDFLLHLETVQSSNHIVRRFLMVQLTRLLQLAARETGCTCSIGCRSAQLDNSNNSSRRKRPRKSNRSSEHSRSLQPDSTSAVSHAGRKSCKAVDKLTERYVHHEQYSTRRRKVIDSRSRARVWCALTQHFGIGVLALVPTGGKFGISSSRLERTTFAESFLDLIEILADRRGQVISPAAEGLGDVFKRLLGIKQGPAWRFEEDGVVEKLKGEDIDNDLVFLCRAAE